jgi:hypothetical protein
MVGRKTGARGGGAGVRARSLGFWVSTLTVLVAAVLYLCPSPSAQGQAANATGAAVTLDWDGSTKSDVIG